MSFTNRKYLAVIFALIIACVFVFKIEAAKGKIVSQIDLPEIPKNLGVWQGEDVTVPDYVYEILETKNVLIRRYKDKEGDFLDFSIVYSGHDRQSFHPPEICYLGEGIEVLSKTKEDIPLGNNKSLATNKLVLQAPDSRLKAWYWFSVGDRLVGSFIKQQVYFVLDALRAKKLKGALIRVSIRGESQDLENKARSFIAKITPHLEKAL